MKKVVWEIFEISRLGLSLFKCEARPLLVEDQRVLPRARDPQDLSGLDRLMESPYVGSNASQCFDKVQFSEQ